MTQGQIEKEQEATRSKNTLNIQIVNNRTNENIYTYLKNQYLYQTSNGIVIYDPSKYKYTTGIIDDLPVIVRRQYKPKLFKDECTIDFLDTNIWRVIWNG